MLGQEEYILTFVRSTMNILCCRSSETERGHREMSTSSTNLNGIFYQGLEESDDSNRAGVNKSKRILTQLGKIIV